MGGSSLIQNILKLVKLDAKTISFAKKEDSLNQTIKEVLNSFEEFAKTKNINLKLNDCENIVLFQDRFWLKEAFGNIIKNCIEHTDECGSVEVFVKKTPVLYKVIIKDTGVGIEQSDIPNIFNRFYKSGVSNKKDSVGIGLSISKSIIESHNGYIDVVSEKGVGTNFIITFMK